MATATVTLETLIGKPEFRLHPSGIIAQIKDSNGKWVWVKVIP